MGQGDQVEPLAPPQVGVGQEQPLVDHHLPDGGPHPVPGLSRPPHLLPKHLAGLPAGLVDLQQLHLEARAEGGEQAKGVGLPLGLAYSRCQPLDTQCTYAKQAKF